MKTLTTAVLSALVLSSGTAFATTVDTASSSSYDYLMDMVGVTGTFALPGGAKSSGIAPGPYSDPETKLDQKLKLGGDVQKAEFIAAEVDTNAVSDVDGTAGAKTTFASASLEGFSYYSFFTGGYKVELSIGAMATTSTVSGMPGSFLANSDMSLTNLLLEVNDAPLLNLNGPVAANTFYDMNLLVPGSGITLYLNEQVETCVADSCGIATNGLHMIFTNSPALGGFPVGPVSGHIILAHSQAAMAGVVPEPGSYAMLLAGLGLLGLKLRRRG